MTGRVSQAEISALFKSWIIPHHRADVTCRLMNELREQKRLSGWGVEANGLYLLSKSQVGKTHAVRNMFFQRVLLPECRKAGEFHEELTDDQILRLQRKVLYIKLPEIPHRGALGVTMLEELGDPRPFFGKPYERLARARKQSSALTELLIIDSFDHLTRISNPKDRSEATAMQDFLKLMLESGTPMLFVGLATNSAIQLIEEFQLGSRLAPIGYEFETPEKEIDEFNEYLGCLDVLMAQHGIFGDLCDLNDPYISSRLFQASDRRFGALSNIVRDAAKLASFEREPKIDIVHLRKAVDGYSIRLNLIDKNPF